MYSEWGVRNGKQTSRGRLRPSSLSLTTHHSPLTTHHSPLTTHHSRQQAGITLLELLVSITIVSLLATTALLAWRAGVSAWEKAGRQLEQGRAVLAAHQLLSEQIAAMTPYQAQLESGGQVLFFQGEPQTARFVSRYSLTHRAASGLYLVEYQVAEQQDGTPGGTRGLLLQETPLWGNEALAARVVGIENDSGTLRTRFHPFERGPAAVVLLEGLQECRFEYYRPPTPAQPGSWTGQWLEQRIGGGGGDLPAALRIHAVARQDSGALQPVTMVAAVRNYAPPRPRQTGLSIPGL